MRCTSCGREQENQEYCKKCDASLFVETQREAYWNEKNERKEALQVASTDHVSVGEITQKNVPTDSYIRFFSGYLKKPSHVLATEENVHKNALISIILFILLFPLSFAILSRQYLEIIFRGPFGGLEFMNPGKPTYTGPSFFTIFVYTFLAMVLILVVGLFLFYLVQLAFKSDLSFKKVMDIYGTHLTPAILMVVISLLFGVVKLFAPGYYLLFVSFILLLLTLPIYYIANLFTHKAKQGIAPQNRLFYGLLAGSIILLTIAVLTTSLGKEILLDLINPYW